MSSFLIGVRLCICQSSQSPPFTPGHRRPLHVRRLPLSAAWTVLNRAAPIAGACAAVAPHLAAIASSGGGSGGGAANAMAALEGTALPVPSKTPAGVPGVGDRVVRELDVYLCNGELGGGTQASAAGWRWGGADRKGAPAAAGARPCRLHVP